MEPPEWAQVRRILYDALELTPERRSAYLDDACQGNPALRAELESLLSASENATVVDRPVLPPSKLGPYEIGAKIGEGGMGAVYKAVDTRLGRTVALKLIAGPSADWRQERRFAREAKAASSLNHPGIVTIYEFDRQDGVDFIAMEYVEGTPLNKLIEEGATPLPVLLGYMRQAAVAIGKAHAAGIVHRDLKPANLMVTAEGQVKVLDFGLAKRQRASTDPEVTQTQALTREGISVGTPAYMSPEQVLAEPEDARSDIFSFGIILYEIAAGRRPFGGTEARATLYRIVHEEPAAASLGPAVPPALASLIARCLRKNRAERPQSMDEVAAALTDITSAPSGRPGISRRALVADGALGVAALAAGLWTLRPPARVLTYNIEAQKMRDGSPVGEPYTASPADIFEGGWRFRLRLRSPQPGFLYLVNEGPGEQGVSRLWVLYPAKVSAAPLAANQDLATDWYVFDPNPGTEKLWVVWAYQAIGSMEEALRGSDHGEVTNSTSAQGLRTLLAGLAKSSSSGAPGSLQIRGTAGASAILLQLHHR